MKTYRATGALREGKAAPPSTAAEQKVLIVTCIFTMKRASPF
jgi:hypothetical protein